MNDIPAEAGLYNDTVVRQFSLMAVVWGVVGMLVGVVIAAQLALPELNFGIPWLSYGRLRPLHTNAVIFAFGGCVLFATSYYVAQRTCHVRLFAGKLASFTDKIPYKVTVTDPEDGTTGAGIDCANITVKISLGHDEHAHDLMDPNAANRPLRTVRPVTELARQALEAQPLREEEPPYQDYDYFEPVRDRDGAAAIIRPRRRAGMNSMRVAAATTTSAPRPTLIRKRSAMSHVMFGAAAAAIEKPPNIRRLIWKDTRRPNRSERMPAIQAPTRRPRKVDDRNQPFSVRFDSPLLTSVASTAPAKV